MLILREHGPCKFYVNSASRHRTSSRATALGHYKTVSRLKHVFRASFEPAGHILDCSKRITDLIDSWTIGKCRCVLLTSLEASVVTEEAEQHYIGYRGLVAQAERALAEEAI